MKTIQVVVSVQIDEGLVSLDARRFKRTDAAEMSRLISDVECRLHDAVRFRDAVGSVQTRVVTRHLAL